MPGESWKEKMERGMREARKALKTYSIECGGPDYETANFYLQLASEAAAHCGLPHPKDYDSLWEKMERLRELDEFRNERKRAVEEVKSERHDESEVFDPFITEIVGYRLKKPRGDVASFFSLFYFHDKAQKKVEDF